MIEKNSLDNARIFYYSLLSRMFVFTYDLDRFKGLREAFKLIGQNPLNDLCKISALNVFENFDEIALSDEYDQIFHAPPSPVRTTLSFYNEGYESAQTTVMVKKFIGKTKIRKDSNFIENEDNFGFLFTAMSEFITFKTQGDYEYEDIAREFFIKFLNPFVDEFLNNIYIHKHSILYKDISNLGLCFFEFERAYYGVSDEVGRGEIKVNDGLSRSEKTRRESNKQKRSKGARDAIK
ncbi:molecular chaperone TorD family protein [Campylobacter sp. FMV-PI01]|uniref:Molecular chaperone TorD family protein n=1 Tax=Campylobacter portucalensis TaxID=2608384 RepID=A0A6L5WFL1_9BACT|nr:molecular chaperone TorD family protein [Campylobacter portucalensis]MSN95858.1 molecular chaperone TorD family protein [Campylobacter portucalensis]